MSARAIRGSEITSSWLYVALERWKIFRPHCTYSRSLMRWTGAHGKNQDRNEARFPVGQYAYDGAVLSPTDDSFPSRLLACRNRPPKSSRPQSKPLSTQSNDHSLPPTCRNDSIIQRPSTTVSRVKDHVLPIFVNRHPSRPIQSMIAAHEQRLCCSGVRTCNRVGRGVVHGVAVRDEATGREEEDVIASCLHERWAFDRALVCCSVVVENGHGVTLQRDSVGCDRLEDYWSWLDWRYCIG